MQAVLLHLLTQPAFSQHLDAVRSCYRQRYRALAQALGEQLADEGRFDCVDGGMFIWLRLQRGEPMAIARAAMARGVAVVPGDVFYCGGERGAPALRLNFSHSPVELLATAVERLCAVITA